MGNVEALKPEKQQSYAKELLRWLQSVEKETGGNIKRIAIDAPKHSAGPGEKRREAEIAMDRCSISCFATPTKTGFDAIIKKAEAHVAAGHDVARMPHSNQIWMLVGFELFRVLAAQNYDCIEVYPQAIVQGMSAGQNHKSTAEGYDKQVDAVAAALGYEREDLLSLLPEICFGKKDDRLDALMSAWIASLEEGQRTGLGTPPDDVIWVPSDELINTHQLETRSDLPIESPRLAEPMQPRGRAKTKLGSEKTSARRQIDEQAPKGSEQTSKRKACPECGHAFKGSGWSGIDAHWKANHERIMPYELAWHIIRKGGKPSTVEPGK